MENLRYLIGINSRFIVRSCSQQKLLAENAGRFIGGVVGAKHRPAKHRTGFRSTDPAAKAKEMMQNCLTQRTRLAYARVAGAMFLLYIAAGIPAMILFNRAAAGENVAAKLASIGEHASEVKAAVLLSLLICFIAILLAVALFVIMRDADPNLALLALICRVAEGILNAFFIVATLGLLWLGTTAAGETGGVNTASASALGSFLLKAQDWNTVISAIFFSVGSMVFSYLLWRYRMIPGSLALLGLIASILLVVYLPLQLVGFFGGGFLGLFVWLPMLVFEVALSVWLLVKGVDLGTELRIAESSQS